MRFRELFEQDYVVNKGDTLWALAKKYGSSVNDIAKASGIKDTNKLQIGQKLVIPTASQPASAATISAPIAAKPISQNPANITGAPISLPAAKISQNPANITGAPISLPAASDPVAAAKAKATAASNQAAALQAQIDKNQSNLVANQQQKNLALFKKADAASVAAIPPPAKPMSRNPINATGINLSVPSDKSNSNITPADAKIGKYVQNPKATNLPMSSPLRGFDLGQYGRDKAAAAAAKPKPFDLGQYGRDKIAAGENPGASAGTPKIDLYNQPEKGFLPKTVPLNPAAATDVTDPQGSLKDFDIGNWLKNVDLRSK